MSKTKELLKLANAAMQKSDQKSAKKFENTVMKAKKIKSDQMLHVAGVLANESGMEIKAMDACKKSLHLFYKELDSQLDVALDAFYLATKILSKEGFQPTMIAMHAELVNKSNDLAKRFARFAKEEKNFIPACVFWYLMVDPRWCLSFDCAVKVSRVCSMVKTIQDLFPMTKKVREIVTKYLEKRKTLLQNEIARILDLCNLSMYKNAEEMI